MSSLSTVLMYLLYSKGWLKIAAATFLVVANAQDQPLLSTIASIPTLSTFSSVLNVTGGNKPNPALYERFNAALDGRNYTALVPTNDASAKVSPGVVGVLTTAPAYPILEAILRTHIAEGLVTSTNIISASPIVAIEGFPLAAQSTNGGSIFVNGQAQVVAVDTFASNGVIHQIDQILNPFTAYFGVSNATTVPQTSDTDGSVADILINDERLTNIRDVLLALQPDFVQRRLRLSASDGSPQIFAAPSNDAFNAAPVGTVESSIAPSNQPLSLQLFTFGLLSASARLSDLDLSAEPVQVASMFTGINVTMSPTSEGAILLNNAAIQAEVCGFNGCVWIVYRILDPLYLAFGPLDRSEPAYRLSI